MAPRECKEVGIWLTQLGSPFKLRASSFGKRGTISDLPLNNSFPECSFFFLTVSAKEDEWMSSLQLY